MTNRCLKKRESTTATRISRPRLMATREDAPGWRSFLADDGYCTSFSF